MNVRHLMTSPATACHAGDSLTYAARIMWECDCGAVPVIDAEGKPIAMITDRDICMAAFTQGRPLHEIPVAIAMSQKIVTCGLDEPLAMAEALMRGQQIRRLPVVDREGRLAGILSLNDIATHAHVRKGAARHTELGADSVVATLSAIGARTREPSLAAE